MRGSDNVARTPAYLLDLLSQSDQIHGISDSVGVVRTYQLQSVWTAVGFHQRD